MATIVIIGKSRAGVSLARALRLAGMPVQNVAARSNRYPVSRAEVIVIATRDVSIASVAKKAAKQSGPQLRLLLHLAGSLPPDILPTVPNVARLTLHPLQTFAKPSSELVTGITWMACTADRFGLRWAKQITKLLSARGLIQLKDDQLALYHAMTVFASNYLVLLGGAVEEIAFSLGQNPTKMKAAVRPLMEAALQNVLRNPSQTALTGPIKRKDFETIRRHQSALRAPDPKLRKLYDAFLDWAISRGY